MDYQQEAKLHFLDYWRVIRVRLGLVTLIFLLVVISAGIVTYLLPRKYRSFATIEVQPDMQSVRIFDTPGEQHPINDPKFAQTQFQIILRKGILYPVMEKLKLQQKWGTNGETLPLESAYDKLVHMLSLQEIRNTNLIEIDVYSTDPREAAILANTIADVYMEERIAEQQSTVSKGLDQLREEVNKNEESVRKAFDEASRLRTQANIIDPNPDSLDASGRVEDSSVLSNQEKVNESRSQVATLESRVKELDKLTSGDLMRAAGQLNLNDPIIEQKLPIYQTAQAEKAKMLSSGLGPNHPDVKAVQAEIDTLEGQLKTQIESIRRGLQTQLAIAKQSLETMESNLEASRQAQQTEKTASAQYLDAKYKYIQERKLLEIAKSRLASETMEKTMPQKPAFVRDQAEPSLFPAKPNVLFNMLVGIAAGLILAVSTAFFLEYLDTSVKTMEDVERFLDLPVLAVIPRGIRLLPRADEDTPDAEAYRILKTNVDFNRRKSGATVLNVVSGGASEGKSTTVCNLATTWAASGQQVLVVDGDMRRPRQHELFEVNNEVGLGNYLKGQASFDEVVHPTQINHLYLVPAGNTSTEAVTLLNSDVMHSFIELAKERFDVVLFDSPPILGVSDGSMIASVVESSIIVVQHRRFPRSMLLRVKRVIENIGGNLLGVVMNNVDVRHDQNYQYYTAYKTYYSKAKDTRKPGPKPAAKAV
ncbi:MAG: polysaccharide biosynthesis tyrosine autokinase, partial [Verrucomicrobia bacterium]|nr:polysaccharide biosynthesis tyrosine autokinase [Verrucomicrobiota bacterium]